MKEVGRIERPDRLGIDFANFFNNIDSLIAARIITKSVTFSSAHWRANNAHFWLFPPYLTNVRPNHVRTYSETTQSIHRKISVLHLICWIPQPYITPTPPSVQAIVLLIAC